MPNEIIENLYLGDMNDARSFDGERLCVLEGALQAQWPSHHVPILVNNREGFYASKVQLDMAAELINQRLAAGAKLLVHCAAGVERSPLTIAWWMVKTGRHSTLAAAYIHLQQIRPIVADRTEWLEK